MAVAAIKFVTRLLSLSWLSGPIFQKELRVSSRRRRLYLLRFLYVVVLSLFVLGVWANTVGDIDSGGANAIYKMSSAGKAIIGTISWFQFITIQLVAVILLSTSISEEIYRGTFGALLSTPISSLQIVFGKLLSKMLYLLVLLLISLPLLAVVRVFGGVPWDYVIASSCITLTAALLAGSIAMFYSCLFRRAFSSILLTLATGVVLYAILPLITGLFIMAVGLVLGSESLSKIFMHLNPFWAMGFCTLNMAMPQWGGALGFSWPIHCLIMLGFSVVVLLFCVRLVRWASRRSAFGDSTRRSVPPVMPAAPPVMPAGATPPVQCADLPQPVATTAGPIPFSLQIKGSPLVWKKLHLSILPSGARQIVALVLVTVLVSTVYVLLAVNDVIDEEGVHAAFGGTYAVFALVSTAVLAATSITSEKERRTLPLLLTTPLSDWHIVGASMVEVFRRSLPAWGILLAHAGFFSIIGFVPPLAVPLLMLLWGGMIMFLGGAGVYFSASCKRTTPAVTMNLCLALTLWLLLPVIIPTIGLDMQLNGSDLHEGVITMNPIVQGGVIMGAGGWENSSRGSELFHWPTGSEGGGGSAIIMLISFVGYSAVGLFLLWRAKKKLRRKIY